MSLKKEERLHHKKLVEELFKSGKSFYEYPLRVIWKAYSPQQLNLAFSKEVPAGIGKLQMLIAVPKKKRKKAVDRVLLRRRIREAYRLNRVLLKKGLESENKIDTLSVAFIYQHTENCSYSTIEEKMKTALARLNKLFVNQEADKNT